MQTSPDQQVISFPPPNKKKSVLTTINISKAFVYFPNLSNRLKQISTEWTGRVI